LAVNYLGETKGVASRKKLAATWPSPLGIPMIDVNLGALGVWVVHPLIAPTTNLSSFGLQLESSLSQE
jgi:hypothetical protein